MVRLIVGIICLPLFMSTSFADIPQTDARQLKEKSSVRFALLEKSFSKIFIDYTSLPKTAENVEKLYQLHLRVKKLREEVLAMNSGVDFYARHQKDCAALGLYIGHFSEALEYSNDLLIEIQTINPNSAHQEEAWYAVITKGREYGGPGDVEALKEYIKQYPEGKYSSRIYYDLGNYYYGLYKHLKYEHDSETDRSSCYEYDSNRSIQEQLKEAQSAGVEFYKKSLDLDRERSMTNTIQLNLWALSSGKNTEPDAWCDTVD